jgi:uncharacterized membrane protein YGL010W
MKSTSEIYVTSTSNGYSDRVYHETLKRNVHITVVGIAIVIIIVAVIISIIIIGNESSNFI